MTGFNDVEENVTRCNHHIIHLKACEQVDKFIFLHKRIDLVIIYGWGCKRVSGLHLCPYVVTYRH